MNILLGLAPFIAFFVLMRLATPLVALAAAFVVSAFLMVRAWRAGVAPKLLELGSLILFGALTVVTLAVAPDWSIAGVRLAVDGGLTAIVAISLAIGRPFTLQYAREQVAEQFWKTPLFFRTNQYISGVWGLSFAVSAAADAAALYFPAVPLWIEIAATVAAFLGAIAFTQWYPNRVRRNLPAAQTVSS
jgi:hypothetical protein